MPFSVVFHRFCDQRVTNNVIPTYVPVNMLATALMEPYKNK